MFNTQLDAIVPMLCVTLAALASMGAEALRRPGERTPIGALGIIGLMSFLIGIVIGSVVGTWLGLPSHSRKRFSIWNRIAITSCTGTQRPTVCQCWSGGATGISI